MHSTIVYVGNRRPRPSSWDTPAPPDLGIGIFAYDDADGSLHHLKDVCQDVSVGAVWIDPNRNVLYCVHESMTLPGYNKGGGGQVCAFAIDSASGDLREINRQPSHGSLPSYVVVDRSGQYLLVTNHTGHTPVTRSARDASGAYRIELQYDDATTVLYRLGDDGAIGDACDVFVHEGKGGPLPLQTHSQLHSIEPSPSGDVFVVADKGSDEVAVFTLDRDDGRLALSGGAAHKSVPGSSPRYTAFHPTLPYFYVNHETKPIISTYRYTEEGVAELMATLDISDGSRPGVKLMQSDLRIHPAGTFMYDLVRGSDEVKVLRVDQVNGAIALAQTVKLEGAGPRGCTISPDGRFLLIAALVSQQVLVYAIGPDGSLSLTGLQGSQLYPGNITFYRR